MIQPGTRFMLLAVSGLLFAACAQPVRHDSAQSGAHDSDTPGIVVASPGAAQKSTGAGPPFPPAPAGYRDLGGVFIYGGSTMVITPDPTSADHKHDIDVGILHGMAAGGYSETASSKARIEDCEGAGDTPDAAITVRNLAEPAGEVFAGISCARLRHPGTHWVMSQLIAKGDHYISQVALHDAEGNTIVVYTDINRLAEQLIRELDE